MSDLRNMIGYDSSVIYTSYLPNLGMKSNLAAYIGSFGVCCFAQHFFLG